MNIYKDIHEDIDCNTHASISNSLVFQSIPIAIKAHLEHGLDDPYRSAAENFWCWWMHLYQLYNYAAGQIPDITLNINIFVK